MGSHMPPELLDRLFEVVGGKRKIRVRTSFDYRRNTFFTRKSKPEPYLLSKRSFLCGLAVILRGTDEEKLRVLFDTMDVNTNRKLTVDEVYTHIKLCQDTDLRADIEQAGGSRAALAEKIFLALREVAGDDIEADDPEDDGLGGGVNNNSPYAYGAKRKPRKTAINFREFYAWAKDNPVPGLSSWLRNIPRAASGTGMVNAFPRTLDVLKTARFWTSRKQMSIAGLTRFDEKELSDLEQNYHSLLSDSSGRIVSKSRLKKVFTGTEDAMFERIFAAFDADGNGVVDAQEFLVGMSMCCRGSIAEKIKFAFKVFDKDRSGKLDESELLLMMRSIGVMPALHRLVSRQASSESQNSSVAKPTAETPAVDTKAPARPAALARRGSVTEQAELPQEILDLISRLVKEAPGGKVDVDAFLASSLRSHLTLGFFSNISQVASLRLGVRPRDAQEEGRIVSALRADVNDDTSGSAALRNGDSLYLIDSEWAKQWASYTGADVWKLGVDPQRINDDTNAVDRGEAKTAPNATQSNTVEKTGKRPGPVDNTSILAAGSLYDLKRNIKAGTDFLLVRPRVWSLVAQWYGGGPMVVRKIISSESTGGGGERLSVELYPWTLNCFSLDGKLRANISFSRAGRLDQLKKKVCQQLEIDIKQTRLWSYYRPDEDEKTFSGEPELLESTITVEDAQLVDGQSILIERRVGDGKDNVGKWEGLPGVGGSGSEDMKKKSSVARSVGNKYRHGRVGLWNLGNTCFMNAALQALSATVPLSEYFLSNIFIRELNLDNKFGMEGKVAVNYARHIKELWSSNGAVAPRGIKRTMARKNPQFIGYQQQDSQELIMSLLDGLHEDLNRVMEKPYVQIPDSEGRSDAVVAREQLAVHRRRERSVIFDLFGGVTKSTITWPDAPDAEKRKFEVFTTLSLPCPKDSERHMSLVVVFDNPNRVPLRVSLVVSPFAELSQVKQQLAEMKGVGVPAKQLLLCDVANNYVYQHVSETFTLEQVKGDTLYVFQVPEPPESARTGDAKRADAAAYDMALKVGKEFDVMDRDGNWYPGVVTKYDEKSRVARVHFHDFPPKYDENVHADSGKFAPPNTKARRARVDVKSELTLAPATAIVVCLHRRFASVDSYFLSPYKPELFAKPIVLFLNEKTTGADLYKTVWEKTRRYTTVPNIDAKAFDRKGEQRAGGAVGDADNGSRSWAKSMPPFVLSQVNRSGRVSSVEPWSSFTFGTPIEFDEKSPLDLHDCTIAIDWNPDFVKQHLNMQEFLAVKDHPSVPRIAALPEPRVDIAQCFKLFTNKERLADELYCRAKKKHLPAQKQIELFAPPPVLAVHLKRLLPRRKIQTYIDCPLTDFDVTPFLSKGSSPNLSLQSLAREQDGKGESKGVGKGKKKWPVYDLYAVINHYGSAYGGHYVAFAKSKKDGKEAWYCFDDSRVRQIPEDKVVTRHAYMLFYKQRDLEGLSFLPEAVQKLGSKGVSRQEQAVIDAALREPMIDWKMMGKEFAKLKRNLCGCCSKA